MKFQIFNRMAMEASEPPDEYHVVISITTPGDPNEAKIATNNHTCGVLRLSFHDLDTASMPEDVHQAILKDEPHLAEPGMLFDMTMARKVVDFVADTVAQQGGHLDLVLVHCDAGISRSPAVAAAIAKGIGQDDSDFFRRYLPNLLVYRSIVAAYEEDD